MKRLNHTQAHRGIVILLTGLCLAALLDARGLHKQAETQPQGRQRDAAIRITSSLLGLSTALHLTVPRRELQAAIGRSGEDEINPAVELGAPPPAAPAIMRSGHSKAPKPPSKPRPRRPGRKPTISAAHPLRVWIAGDSLAQVPGDGLERVAPRSVDVIAIESRLSTGLARPDLYNWFARLKQILNGPRPDVAVLSFGADDAHNYLAGIPGHRKVGPFGSASWKAEYRRRVDGVTRELTVAGIRTVWLGLPITDGRGFRKSFRIVNQIISTVAEKYAPMSAFVDTWKILASSNGGFTPYLRVHGTLTLMRLPDGVHYTAAAGDLIAQRMLKTLGTHYIIH